MNGCGSFTAARGLLAQLLDERLVGLDEREAPLEERLEVGLVEDAQVGAARADLLIGQLAVAEDGAGVIKAELRARGAEGAPREPPSARGSGPR